MAGKRTATSDLNHDNWDDYEPEEAGSFKRASEDVLQKRVMKTARRRRPIGEESSTKNVFSSFTAFGKPATQAASDSPFAFLANMPNSTQPKSNGLSSSTSTASSSPMLNFKSAPMPMFKSPEVSKPENNKPLMFKSSEVSKSENKIEAVKPPENGTSTNKPQDTDKNSNDYYANLKGLNESVSQWIKTHVDKNPFCILTPIFKDYEKYLNEIEAKKDKNTSIATSNSSTLFGQTKTSSTSIFGSNSTSNVSKPSFETNTTPSKTPTFDIPKFEAPKVNFNSPKPDTKIIFEPVKSNTEPPKSEFGSPKTQFDVPKINFEAPKSNFESPKINFEVPKPNFEAAKPNFEASKTNFEATKPSFDAPKINFEAPKTGFDISKPTFGSPIKTDSPFGAVKSPFGDSAKSFAGSGFSFGSGTPFTFANVSKPPSEEKKPEEEEEEPPKPEFTPVVEEDNIFSKRCKVFVKKDGNYGDRGVGTLFLKPVSGSEKVQLIVRADTNLGNLILNFILSDQLPMQRMGKNNVMIVCIPTPDTKPPPVPVLLRVKTTEEADELLKVLEKNKK